ncbi:HEPN domain-containing protein [Desulfobacca acetoxidans]|uniref:Uncharacterized protein n=1 Tax=Desulfobacca acetoxidans (strain ATCC 700848 / DSM 11109 / ASRB2) TaxID=880072 RepID=F2NDD8_DESAR|nr:HEPN domain-containing protein [Desulfobacca acetoxidans]AEB10004.1 hypothetical protein Desac_2175 [Desulfobacca acetoxidans DSM 11109]
MSAELKSIFIEYADRVSSLSQRVAILPDKKRHISDLVQDIEKGPEFHKLVLATRDEFGHTGNRRNESAWRRAVGNVLRRSGFYIYILEKNLHDPSEEFEKYVHVFKSPKKKISYLGLLEYVSFEQDDIDFGNFQIKRFSRDDLDSILGNSINEIFYPWAAVDLNQIEDYWFIYLQQSIQVKKIIPSTKVDYTKIFSDDSYSRVEMTYTPRPFPEPLESVIKPLVLFDWQTDYWRGGPADEKEEKATGWMGFNIPFVLKVTDILYEPSFPAPSPEKLDKTIERVTENGEEIWGPEFHISLDKQETESFITVVKRTHENLQKLDLEKSGWHFFNNAFDMLVKAFFTGGLEQLLWHITAIDALLGERGGGLTKKLSRRIAFILGETEQKQKELQSRFEKLYNFRSALVHGKIDSKESKDKQKNRVYISHLREARDFARQTIVWFLEFLLKIQDGISQSQGNIEFPKRDLLLKLLDMDATERSQLKTLLQILPPDFPHLLGK